MLWEQRKVIVFYGLLVLIGLYLGSVLKEQTIPELGPMNEPAIQLMVMSVFVLFVVLAAIPFVPGAEVGFTLLLVFGSEAAPLVYFGMVGSLLVSYGIARLVPAKSVARALNWLGLKRAATLGLELDATPQSERLGVLSRIVPSGAAHHLLRHRYLLLAVVLNTPGNSLLGGGGGLAFVAGASRLFGFWQFLATIVCAVAPVPLFFLLT